MDEVTGMIWNAVLSLIVAPLIIIIGAQVKELRRIDILLNRTREELGRDYVSKNELDSSMLPKVYPQVPFLYPIDTLLTLSSLSASIISITSVVI